MLSNHSFVRPGRRCAFIAACAGLACAPSLLASNAPSRRAERAQARAQERDATPATDPQRIESTWVSAESGDWTDSSRWSPGVPPDNATGFLFDVRIDATGAPYSVSFTGSRELASLTLDSTDANLVVAAASTLNLLEDLTINAGQVRSGATLRARSLQLNAGEFVLTGANALLELQTTLRPNDGVFRFQSGTIRSAVIDTASPGFILDGTDVTTFENVTLDGGMLTVDHNQLVRLRDDFRATNGGGLLLDLAMLELDGDFVLRADMNIRVSESRPFTGVRITQDSNVTFETEFAPGARRRSVVLEDNATLTNRSTLENAFFDAASNTLFVNEGVVRESQLEGDWINDGVIEDASLINGFNAENRGVMANVTIDGGQWTNTGVIRGVISRNNEWTNSGIIELNEFLGSPPGSPGSSLGGSGVNFGVIRVPAGGFATISGDWTNQGTIDARHATLSIQREVLDPAFFEQVLATGGVVSLGGAWDNAGVDYIFPQDNGRWVLSGATISGGSITFNSDIVTRDAVFRDMTLTGVMDTGRLQGLATSLVQLESGTRLEDLTISSQGDAEVRVARGVALGTTDFMFTEAFDRAPTLLLENAADHALDAGGSIIGAGAIAEWQVARTGDTRLLNAGQIRATDGALDIELAEVANTGALEAIDGWLTINAALVQNDNAIVVDRGVVSVAPALLESSGRFTNAGSVTIENGGAFTSQNELVNTGTIDVRSFGSLDYDPVGVAPVLVNDGAIIGGESTRLTLRNLVNTGTVEIDGGAAFVDSIVNDGDLIIRAGSVRGASFRASDITNRGSIIVGPNGAIQLFDIVQLEDGGALRFEINEDTLDRADALVSASNPVFGGALEIALADGAIFDENGRVTLIDAFTSIDGEFQDILLPSVDGLVFQLDQTNDRLDLIVVVPAPGAGATLGMAALCMVTRRRRR